MQIENLFIQTINNQKSTIKNQKFKRFFRRLVKPSCAGTIGRA
jgi:hypothetical protein